MPFQAAPGIAQVIVEQQLRGEYVLNILHYELSGGWTAVDLAALADQIKTNWKHASGLASRQSNQVSIGRVLARDLSVQAGAEVISTVADGTGSSATAALENSLAAVVTLGTGIAGRSYRGRTYLGGLHSGQLVSTSDPNHLNALDAAAIAAAAEYTFTNGLAAGVSHVVLSRQNNNVLRPNGIGTEVASYTVNTRLDNQRRRMPKL